MKINKIAVLGGGSAGLIAALTLKKQLPDLPVEVVYASEGSPLIIVPVPVGYPQVEQP